MGGMPSPVTIIKAATSVLAASAALLTALRENPQLSEGAKSAVGKIRKALTSKNPKVRFEAKLTAIEACADAVEVQYPAAPEVTAWRQMASTLRVRGDLAWHAKQGKERKAALAELNDETTTLLAQINARLAELTPGAIPEAAREAVEEAD